MTDTVNRQAQKVHKALRAKPSTIQDMEALANTLRKDLRTAVLAMLELAALEPEDFKAKSVPAKVKRPRSSFDLNGVYAQLVTARSMEQARDVLKASGATVADISELAQLAEVKLTKQRKDLMIEDFARQITQQREYNTMARSAV